MNRPDPSQHRRHAAVYATLGQRFLAVLIDSVIIGALFVVVLMLADAAGALDLTTYRDINPLHVDVPRWSYPTLYGLLFLYYTAFELRRGATPGKVWLHLRVTTFDGRLPAPGAVVLRNLIRVPEAIFYYLPSAIGVLATARHQRLGDLAAHTVVLRLAPGMAAVTVRAVKPGGAASPSAPGAARPSPASVSTAPPASPTPAAELEEALERLKTAALVLRGAHHNYVRLSEHELERGGGVTADFSPEYTAAWHTLVDAAAALRRANSEAAASATAAGTDLQAASAGHPDMVGLCLALEPYFTAVSEEQVQDACLGVARREAPPPTT